MTPFDANNRGNHFSKWRIELILQKWRAFFGVLLFLVLCGYQVMKFGTQPFSFQYFQQNLFFSKHNFYQLYN